MKKKTKTVIGVILAVALVAVLVVVGFMTYLGITWTNNHEFGEYVSKARRLGQNDTTIDSTSGNMKFDGTTFTITDLDKEIFGTNEFNYVITDKEFSPD